MDVEKSLLVPVPAQRLWAVLLDPRIMAACVPGMQSVEVVSDTEYVAHIRVKLSFISANFKVRTRVAEMRAPEYLRSDSAGEDRSVASSLKSVSEVFLTPQEGGGTELCVKVKAELLGRLGTFGLNVMKTKADRMWEEFARNLIAHLGGATPKGAEADTRGLEESMKRA
ncbi:MAG: SRPBCC family protein [Rhodospirillales bacterium]|nr:SRPBCC family protein [Rhodospirillales bacterium]